MPLYTHDKNGLSLKIKTSHTKNVTLKHQINSRYFLKSPDMNERMLGVGKPVETISSTQ